MPAEHIVTAKDADIVTVKGTFLKAKGYLFYLLSKWILILIFCILGAAIGFYVAYSTKPTYTATLNFVLSTGSKSSNISGLASQLGIDVGGTQSNDVFTGDNILVLFKSKKLIKEVLFKKPPESNELLANIIARELKLDKQWLKKERTKNLFPFPENKALAPVQDSLLREIYNIIIKKQLTVTRKDAKLSIYTVSTVSTNEVFACYLTRYLMDATAEFYINTKTSSARQSLQLLQKEADSLRGMLNGSIVRTASEADRTFALNPAMQVQRAPAQTSQVKTTVLAATYGEIVKNLELAKINLQKENPLYQIIDVPEMPLVVEKAGKLKGLILGWFMGAIAIIIFLTLSKLIKSLNS
jgi:hypothetical protein